MYIPHTDWAALSPPSPLRGGIEGGGVELSTSAAFADDTTPTPLPPPLKGERNAATAFYAIAPILLPGWFSQKQLERGLTFGAVK